MEMKLYQKYFMIILFGIIILFPSLAFITGKDAELAGVSAANEKPALSLVGVMDGSYFAGMDTYVSDNLPGRNMMIKVRNQVMFSCFGKSPNSNILVGKNKNLFESNYLDEYMQISRQGSDEYLMEMKDKLLVLEERLNEKGIELMLFLTPSKARYYAEDIPEAYRKAGTRTEVCNHDRWVNILEESGLSYFDTIPYMDEYMEEGQDVFYKTGTHWTNTVAAKVTREFAEYFEKDTGYNLPEFEVYAEPTEYPEFPDADIFDTLNLFMKPYDSYETSECIVTEEETDAPNVFLRGGSFMGQSLKRLVDIGAFGKDVHFENNYIHKNRYSETEFLSGFKMYDEVDLEELFKDTDVLILEMNEAAISDMTWGFIDYMLEHPEIIDHSRG